MNAEFFAMLLTGCGVQTDPGSSSMDDAPNVPDPLGATVQIEFRERGSDEMESFPWLAVLSADVGETCVTSWTGAGVLGPTPVGMESFPLPVEPLAGLVYALPSELPDRATAGQFYFPQIFSTSGGPPFAWFGGTWTFREWSLVHAEVDLEGGMTCEYDLEAFSALAETCVPDSGSIVFDNSVGDHPLEVTDPGYRGAPAAAIDPESGELLCQRITSFPDPKTGGD